MQLMLYINICHLAVPLYPLQMCAMVDIINADDVVHLLMTQCQDEVRILSGRTQKLKMAKQCWKQLNEHNLMYIYHKQCENM